MPKQYACLAEITVGAGGAANIDFTSIPGTYTDLCLKISARTTSAGSRDDVKITVNNDTGSNYSGRRLYAVDNASGSQSSSGTPGDLNIGAVTGNGATSSAFANIEFFVSSYAGSNSKVISFDWVTENNSADAWMLGVAGIRWSSSSAITSLKIESKAGNNFVQHTRASLYGIINS